MFKYTYHCSKCGHTIECADKQEWLLEKKGHKRGGCDLHEAPHRGMTLLVRKELAEEAKAGQEMVAAQLSLDFGDAE